MQILVSGHQVDITAPLNEYVSTKFDRILRHFDHLLNVSVTLSVEKLIHKAEATLNTSGKVIHAEASAEEMYAAIDALADKLDRQVKKHKEKLTDYHRADLPREIKFG